MLCHASRHLWMVVKIRMIRRLKGLCVTVVGVSGRTFEYTIGKWENLGHVATVYGATSLAPQRSRSQAAGD